MKETTARLLMLTEVPLSAIGSSIKAYLCTLKAGIQTHFFLVYRDLDIIFDCTPVLLFISKGTVV